MTQALPQSGKSYIITFKLGRGKDNTSQPVHCNVKAHFGDEIWLQYAQVESVTPNAITPFDCDENDNFIVEAYQLKKWVEWDDIQTE